MRASGNCLLRWSLCLSRLSRKCLLDLMRLLSIGLSQTRGAHEIFLTIPSSTSLRYSDDAIQLSFQCGRLLNFSRQVIKSKSHQVKNGKRLLPLDLTTCNLTT